MKGKMKIMLLGILAACALSAIVSASASATQWHVSGTAFNGTETLTVKIETSTSFVLTSSLPGSSTILISCTTITTIGVLIFIKNKGSASKIAFSGCTISEPAGCVVQPEITTKPVKSELVTEKIAEGVLVFDTFTPASGTEFSSIKLTGGACEGLFHVSGTARGLIVAPGTESTEKKLTFSSSTGSNLKFSKEPATLTGSALFSLSGPNKHLVWSGEAS